MCHFFKIPFFENRHEMWTNRKWENNAMLLRKIWEIILNEGDKNVDVQYSIPKTRSCIFEIKRNIVHGLILVNCFNLFCKYFCNPKSTGTCNLNKWNGSIFGWNVCDCEIRKMILTKKKKLEKWFISKIDVSVCGVCHAEGCSTS